MKKSQISQHYVMWSQEPCYDLLMATYFSDLLTFQSQTSDILKISQSVKLH